MAGFAGCGERQFDYTAVDGTITITRYTGSAEEAVIPETIDGLPVTVIGDSAFADRTDLTGVTIPSTVISIGNLAFHQAQSLTRVILPNILTNIGYGGFSASGLGGITIPERVRGIGEGAFGGCTNLTEITVAANNPFFTNVNGVLFNKSLTLLLQYPAGREGAYSIPHTVTTIWREAFNACSGLTSVTIPESVNSIGDGAFRFCWNLSVITVDEFNSAYGSVDGVLFNKSQTTLIQYPGGKAGNYTIPDSVTSIGDEAFYDCIGLVSVMLPNSVISIGRAAFGNCSGLTSVTIPSSVISIGEVAFYGCTGLTNATIPNGVTSIGYGAFASCANLNAITVEALNSSYVGVDGVLFNRGQTTLIQYPAGKAKISYSIPDSVNSIEIGAFYDCAGLPSIIIPNSVTNIGNGAFYGCVGLTSVRIPNSVTLIGEGVFAFCSGLTNVTIPNSVTTIGDGAFFFCSGLTGVYFTGSAPGFGSAVFEASDKVMVYFLPETTGWEATFAGRPTVLWNPKVARDGGFGVREGKFGFNITGTSGLVVVVEACGDLGNPVWRAVGTNVLAGGSSYFSDAGWGEHGARVYRLRSP